MLGMDTLSPVDLLDFVFFCICLSPSLENYKGSWQERVQPLLVAQCLLVVQCIVQPCLCKHFTSSQLMPLIVRPTVEN